MQELRGVPSLDFLRGFEAAARLLSFTEAAAEMFLTQSALSRQIKALEEQIGVALFVRGHRQLKLTEAGAALEPVVRGVLADLGRTVASLRARDGIRRVNLSTTIPFASLWLIQRLPAFRRKHPDVEVFVSADNQIVDLERGAIDVAVRYTAENRAPSNAERLFGERIVPVASPRLVRDRKRPLKKLADLGAHVLLHLEDPHGRTPWIDWSTWLGSSGMRELVPAGNLRFSQYDLMLRAAIDGQGVALGRIPLIDDVLARGDLVAPLSSRYDAARAYFVLCGTAASTRPEVRQLIDWLVEEARAIEPERGRAGTEGTPKPASVAGRARRTRA